MSIKVCTYNFTRLGQPRVTYRESSLVPVKAKSSTGPSPTIYQAVLVFYHHLLGQHCYETTSECVCVFFLIVLWLVARQYTGVGRAVSTCSLSALEHPRTNLWVLQTRDAYPASSTDSTTPVVPSSDHPTPRLNSVPSTIGQLCCTSGISCTLFFYLCVFVCVCVCAFSPLSPLVLALGLAGEPVPGFLVCLQHPGVGVCVSFQI